MFSNKYLLYILLISLQKAFRNFLEMACHCVVLDLFDEALFQTICYDPEKWLANLLKVSSTIL